MLVWHCAGNVIELDSANNISVARETRGGQVQMTASNDLLLGSGYTNPFVGQLDDIGVWPRALTEAEIRQLYEATSAGR